MRFIKPDDPTYAYLVTLTNGREIVKVYRDDRRAIDAALARNEVVRVILAGGRVVEKADFGAISASD